MRTNENEPIVVQRDVRAVIIPAGVEIKLREGSVGYVTQSLGGSFTVYIEGNLFRIAGEDADAIGKEPLERPELPPDATEEDLRALVWHQLRTCFDPEIPINIVDLGLVYACDLSALPAGGWRAQVRMTLTAPGCGMGEVLVDDVKDKLGSIPGLHDIDVELVFDPPWDRSMMSEAARLEAGLM
ncbi:MAG: putative Fe-S cluster assembly protein SufT [Steroidobacteraceae bacterium]